MINLTIDGKQITTEEGRTILEAASEAGVYIPTLCYHRDLLPIGSCRLCLVEIEGYHKPQAACQTPALEGMAVITQSERLFTLRREFLKLILINHPLDCPQCDKGGACGLQDLVYAHQIEKADYAVERKGRRDAYPSPLIRYWEDRCVMCGRCFHACREISGREAIQIAATGYETAVAPLQGEDCISCGECLALCPVGALTENLSPVKSRPWQENKKLTTCPHCGFGCQLHLHTLDNGYISKVSAGEEKPNGHSLCVRGRFGYGFINDRGEEPLPFIRRAGKEQIISRSAALEETGGLLKEIDKQGGTIGLIISPRVANEELAELARLASSFSGCLVGSSAYYHTGRFAQVLREADCGWSGDYDQINQADLIVVAGADLLANNHLLANRIRGTIRRKGTRLLIVDPRIIGLTPLADLQLRPWPGKDQLLFAALAQRLITSGRYDRQARLLDGFDGLIDSLAGYGDEPVLSACRIGSEDLAKAAGLVGEAENITFIVGSGLTCQTDGLKALINLSLLKGYPEKGTIIPVALQANAWGVAALFPDLRAPEEVIFNDAVQAVICYGENPYQYLNGQVLDSCLSKKKFTLLADSRPWQGQGDHLWLPLGSASRPQGEVISGDGRIRSCSLGRVTKDDQLFFSALAEKVGGKGAGVKPWEDLLAGRLTGRPGGDRQLVIAPGKKRFFTCPPPGSRPGCEQPYRLILRDVSLHPELLAASDDLPLWPGGAEGDTLFISREDARKLGLSQGDLVEVATELGVAHLPFHIRAGLQEGIVEYTCGKKRQGVLRLSRRREEVLEVTVKRSSKGMA